MLWGVALLTATSLAAAAIPAVPPAVVPAAVSASVPSDVPAAVPDVAAAVFDSETKPSKKDLITLDTDISKISVIENVFDHGGAMAKHGINACYPPAICYRLGGFCFNSNAECPSTSATFPIIRCPGERKCKCCIHDDETTPAPVTCPVVTCPSCPTTSGPTRNPSLEWNNVGSDWFVRIEQDLTWDEGRTICQERGLDMYQPKDVMAVHTYLYDNFVPKLYFLGARGNGTHMEFLSGDVLTEDNPLIYPNQFDVNPYTCLVLYATLTDTPLTANVGCTNNRISILCG